MAHTACELTMYANRRTEPHGAILPTLVEDPRVTNSATLLAVSNAAGDDGQNPPFHVDVACSAIFTAVVIWAHGLFISLPMFRCRSGELSVPPCVHDLYCNRHAVATESFVDRIDA